MQSTDRCRSSPNSGQAAGARSFQHRVSAVFLISPPTSAPRCRRMPRTAAPRRPLLSSHRRLVSPKLPHSYLPCEVRSDTSRSESYPISCPNPGAFFIFIFKKTKFQKYMPNRKIFKNGCLSPTRQGACRPSSWRQDLNVKKYI